MAAPSPALLLDTWEQAGRLPPTERALRLLGLDWPQATREQLLALPLGERDARLAALRCRLFGSRLEVRVACPACGAALEFDLDAAVLYGGQTGPGGGELTADGCRLRFRAPHSGDLLAVAGVADPAGARDALLERCVEILTEGPAPAGLPESGLPEPVKERLEQAMEAADPRANLFLALNCPACRHPWRAVFDMVDFLWRELEDWAWRLLHDVHCLARAYGWSEAEILALSPWRRRLYLEWVQP